MGAGEVLRWCAYLGVRHIRSTRARTCSRTTPNNAMSPTMIGPYDAARR